MDYVYVIFLFLFIVMDERLKNVNLEVILVVWSIFVLDKDIGIFFRNKYIYFKINGNNWNYRGEC